MIAIVALGSNIGNSEQTIQDAIQDIANLEKVTLIASSSLYKTKPVGFLDQDDFINAVIKVDTTLEALDFYQELAKLEQKYKRVRIIKDGPRTLDLDVILFNEQIIDSKELVIPHPRAHLRAFVLVPLCEIEPNIIFPTLKQTAYQILESITKADKDSVVKL